MATPLGSAIGTCSGLLNHEFRVRIPGGGHEGLADSSTRSCNMHHDSSANHNADMVRGGYVEDTSMVF